MSNKEKVSEKSLRLTEVTKGSLKFWAIVSFLLKDELGKKPVEAKEKG